MINEAYLLQDWCGQGPRIVVHPYGLPPGYCHTGLSTEDERKAVAVAAKHGGNRKVVHLTTDFKFIEAFSLVT